MSTTTRPARSSAVHRPTFVPTLQVRVMQIAYYSDVTRRDCPTIPLGVMAHIKGQNIYGLGLHARTELSEDELGLLGTVIREPLRRPFDLLKKEFTRVWRDKDGSAFLDLPKRYMGALRFEMKSKHQVLKLPRQLAKHDAFDSDAVSKWTKVQLGASCTDEYWELLEKHSAREPLAAKEKIAA